MAHFFIGNAGSREYSALLFLEQYLFDCEVEALVNEDCRSAGHIQRVGAGRGDVRERIGGGRIAAQHGKQRQQQAQDQSKGRFFHGSNTPAAVRLPDAYAAAGGFSIAL